jgi:hypothetical protein
VSDEVVRETSGRHAGGNHFTVEFRGDEPGLDFNLDPWLISSFAIGEIVQKKGGPK